MSLPTLAGGVARARALLLVLAVCIAGCGGADRITAVSDDLPPAAAATPAPTFTSSFAGGIPFGTFALPKHEFGELYNGGLSVIWPKFLLAELAEIKARGGRVVLSLTGNEKYYKDRNGHFSISRWKERVAEYRNVDFSSYIEDGTIIGHYLIDEPNDAHNWNGEPVSGPIVEELAAFSKQLWPGMATIVRVDPGYLARWSAPYRHLDAAWAQYVTRKGTAQDYIKRNIADAQKLGLALLTGLNIRKGADGGREMSARLIESAGRTILEESYPCAFISWQYDARYLARSDIRAAMESLAPRARARSSQSCHRGNREVPPAPEEGEGEHDGEDGGDGEENEEPPSLPNTRDIQLTLTTYVENGRQYLRLSWTGAAGATVDVYRNDVLRESTRNDGKYIRAPQFRGTTAYEYRICEQGSSICSNTVTATRTGLASR
jgi:hypothetical protein